MMKLTSEQLLALYKKADPKAFTAFFRRTHRLVFGYLLLRLQRRGEAEAALKETYARIHRAVLSYDPSTCSLLWTFAIADEVLLGRSREPLLAVEPAMTPGELAEVAAALDEEVQRLEKDEREALGGRLVADRPLVSARRGALRLIRKIRPGAA